MFAVHVCLCLCLQYMFMFMFMFTVHVGGPRDTPEMRERIRRVRRVCLGKLYSIYIFKHFKKTSKIEFASVKRIFFFSFSRTQPDLGISHIFIRLTNLYYLLAKLPRRCPWNFRISYFEKKLEFLKQKYQLYKKKFVFF